MGRNSSREITIGSLISNVVVPLVIVVAALSIGAAASQVVLGYDSGLTSVVLTLFFGAILYALSLPLYWAIFLREW